MVIWFVLGGQCFARDINWYTIVRVWTDIESAYGDYLEQHTSTRNIYDWSWGWNVCSNHPFTLSICSALDILSSGWKLGILRGFRPILENGPVYFCLTFPSTGYVWKKLLYRCNYLIVWVKGCNSCLTWFWCCEEGMPIFWFECMLARSKKNVLYCIDGRNGIPSLRGDW